MMTHHLLYAGNWVSTYGKGISTFGVSGEGDILFSSVGITGSILCNHSGNSYY